MNAELAKDFINKWQAGETNFHLTTSGSTGPPTQILLEKKKMQWSAANTASVVHPLPSDSLLCCLPCSKIGGLMMLVRAMEWGIPIEVIEPVANPFTERRTCTIVSLAPMQLFHVLSNKDSVEHLKTVRIVIIGGGELSAKLENMIADNAFSNTVFYHSYGMTETYSHIALRTINGKDSTQYFVPFSDVTVTKDSNNCAVIQLPFENQPLQTTDIIALYPDRTFEVLGRSDFMINSGGVKLQPEQIERAIANTLRPEHLFIISSEKDEVLGNKLILIAEKHFEYTLEDLQFLKAINPYAVPKAIRIIETFERNEGGKIKRF
ncbi:MAG: AMP-binding protein [Bacteroidota bacterium]